MRKNVIPRSLQELHFRAVFNFKIVFMQFFSIMEVGKEEAMYDFTKYMKYFRRK